MNDRNVIMVDEMMQAITQTKEWRTIQQTDPDICKSDKELTAVLNELKDMIPSDLLGKLEDMVYGYSTTMESAAILYGIHVANAIRDVSARPQDLSRYVMVRTGRATA